MHENEDYIIAQAFILIKEGVESLDWNKICDAYENITGEKIQPPEKKKSRLENIREMMQTSSSNEKNEENKLILLADEDVKDLTAPQLKKKLIDIGIENDNIKNMKKAQLLRLLNEKQNSLKLPKPNRKDSDKPNIQIISSPYDSSEAEKNEKIASTKIKTKPAKRGFSFKNNDDDEAAIRYNDKPTHAPPWR